MFDGNTDSCPSSRRVADEAKDKDSVHRQPLSHALHPVARRPEKREATQDLGLPDTDRAISTSCRIDQLKPPLKADITSGRRLRPPRTSTSGQEPTRHRYWRRTRVYRAEASEQLATRVPVRRTISTWSARTTRRSRGIDSPAGPLWWAMSATVVSHNASSSASPRGA